MIGKMKKLLLLLLFPVFNFAQEQEYFVDGINIKDIKSEFIEITHFDSASKIDVYIDFGQCEKKSDYPRCLRLTDIEGKAVRFASTPKVLNLFPEYELKWIDHSQNDIYLQRKSPK